MTRRKRSRRGCARRRDGARNLTRNALAWALVLIIALPLPAVAQEGKPAAAFTAEQLDQLAAPIALYPDPLLAQILMASTYPLEVVQAARFAKDNPSLTGPKLDEALKKQSWDDSVKSLVSFPQVVAMMDAKLDWTQQLGDAFLGQQGELMDAVQRLRAKAKAEGNLKSTAQQTVTTEPAAAAPPAAPTGQTPSQVVVQQVPPTVITIQPANPQVVYVPTYNPTVVYGPWPYPAYPPYSYYPPGYVAGTAALSFAAGMVVGGALWGNCNWHGHDVNVNINHYNSYTKNVNTANVASQRTQVQSQRANVQGNASTWQHNPEHRKGTQYRDTATQQRYNRATPAQATQARESFRGRAEQGRQELSGGAAQQFRQGGASGRQPATQARQGGASQPGVQRGAGAAAQGQRGAQASQTARSQNPGAGRSGGGSGGAAFQGLGQGGNVQQYSNRGQTSRQSMGAHGGGGARSGAAGGARGGGGRRR